MGTYVDYDGAMKIPEDKREEFLSRVQKAINLGGIMDVETVSIYGKKLFLLKPVEISKDTSTILDFSYFEDDRWEPAAFNSKEMKLYSEKIGTREFNDVMRVLYSLFAIYDKSPGQVRVGVENISWERSIGWINYLFGTEYCERDVVPLEEREKADVTPFPKVRTDEYFRHLYYLSYLCLPEELRKMPYYAFSDDDRLYWWDGTEEVTISKSVDEVLQMYGRMFQTALQDRSFFQKICGEDFCTSKDFDRKFINLLADINETFKRVFPFESMFYEFIENKKKMEYRVAAGLLAFVAGANEETGKVIEQCNSWSGASKNIICNEARMAMKRYLAVMANKKLRRKYFGF